jgi:hypothetical protein
LESPKVELIKIPDTIKYNLDQKKTNYFMIQSQTDNNGLMKCTAKPTADLRFSKRGIMDIKPLITSTVSALTSFFYSGQHFMGSWIMLLIR